MILKIISHLNDSIINIINIVHLIFIGDQTETFTVCVSYDDLRCYHMQVSYGKSSHVNSSWGQMLSNAIYLGFQRKTFQQTWKVLAAAVPSTRLCTSWINYLLNIATGKRRKSWGPVRRCPARRLGGCPSPSPAECPCPPACLMSVLLLTWVSPRAQAPFELCLLDSSQLLLLWPSEIQLPPCPGSERECISIQSWVIITNSEQDLEKWWNQLRAKEID